MNASKRVIASFPTTALPSGMTLAVPPPPSPPPPPPVLAGASCPAPCSRWGVCAEILPGVYLGSLAAVKLAGQLGFTHLLSVTDFIVNDELPGCTKLHLHLCDDHGADLLQALPTALTFIESALGGTDSATQHTQHADQPESASAPQQQRPAKVLVHCQAGASRSASIVVAYVMRTYAWDLHEALAYVQDCRPVVNPNPGFRRQLELFHSIGCSLDTNLPLYRMWKLQQGSKWVTVHGYLEKDVIVPLPEVTQAGANQQKIWSHRLFMLQSRRARACAALEHKHAVADHDDQQQTCVSQANQDSWLYVHPSEWMLDMTQEPKESGQAAKQP